MSLLTQRYAKAIFEVADKADATDAVSTDLERLSTVLQDPEVGEPVLSPEIKAEVQKRVIDKILGEDAHELTRNLVGVVLRRRRQEIFPELSAAFDLLRRAARGEVLGQVETAKPLDDAGLHALEAHASKLAGKKVTLEVKVDEELIGGVRLRIGNTLYDGSVATAIEDLHRRLMDASL